MPQTKAGVTYNAASLDVAIAAVHTAMSTHRASVLFGVLQAMLQDKISGHTPVERRKGPKPYLTETIEEKIKDWLLQMARIGYGQTQRDVLNKVQELVIKHNIPNPFAKGKPMKKWYRLFMKWHTILKEQMSHALSREQAEVSFDNIICWFWDLWEYLERNGQENLLDNLSHIYNCNETGFPMALKLGKVIAGKGQMLVYQASTSSSKNQITALLASSATGHYILPMIVYPEVQPWMQLHDEFLKSFPQGLFGNSASSWMDSDFFISWLEKGFMKGIKERGMTLPVLLLINRAKGHLSIHISEFCDKHDIIFYVLYPVTTHLIQPMDLVLMNWIKIIYKEEVCIWLQKNPGVLFDKYSFIQVFAVVREWVAHKGKKVIHM